MGKHEILYPNEPFIRISGEYERIVFLLKQLNEQVHENRKIETYSKEPFIIDKSELVFPISACGLSLTMEYPQNVIKG